MPRFFFDAVTISNFALAERLDLIVGRYGKNAVLCSEVFNEMAEGIACGYAQLTTIEDLVYRKKITLVSLTLQERCNYAELLVNLGSGEAACIAAAQSRDGIVVSDDRLARRCCSERKIPVTGTIGILLACCRDGTIEELEADTILAEMIRQGFYSPVQQIGGLL